ncbi:MAG: hypothetical protein AAF235_04110 [Planctomycetota bacterium]
MTRKMQIALIVAASGGVATAQPFGVFGSGATLQANFFQNPQATFDFIDVDRDGLAVSKGTTGAPAFGISDQLAFNTSVESALFRQRSGPFVDTDNGAGFTVNNLGNDDGTTGNSHWHLLYRRTGSGNGIDELIFKGALREDGSAQELDARIDDDDNNPGTAFGELDPYVIEAEVDSGFGSSAFASGQDFNRALLTSNSGTTRNAQLYNASNISGVPYRKDRLTFPQIAQQTGIGDATGLVSANLPLTFGGNSAAGAFDIADFGGNLETRSGFSIDFAAADVPLAWFLNVDGAPAPATAPTAPGYGLNPVEAVNPDGTPAGRTNMLISAPAPILGEIVDTPLVSTPVALITNYGTGVQEMLMSDVRQLSATGRRLNGENLVKVTRDSGSGTRNGFMNGIRLDPSWGRGENVGIRNGNDNTTGRLGPEFLPSNKNGSSRMEFTVQSHRLAVGHTGAERNARWLNVNELEVIAVISDIKGGTVAARPNLSNVLDGGPDGFNIIGPASISTLGDPLAAPAIRGGFGWRPDLTGEDPGDRAAFLAGRTAPANEEAAAFVNNITRSLAAFETTAPGSEFTPGELLATTFVPPASQSFIPDPNPGAGDPGIATVPNPGFNQDLQDFIAANNTALADAVVDSSAAGNVNGFRAFQGGEIPFRQLGTSIVEVVDPSDPGETVDVAVPGSEIAYSEATDATPLPNQYNDAVDFINNFYLAQDGTRVNYGTSIAAGTDLMRNKIAGDFNGDEVRGLGDINDMLEAIVDREGGADWAAPAGSGPNNGGASGGKAIIEVLGDFTGDGGFTRADVRYFADGLAPTPVGANNGGRDWDGVAGADATINRAWGFNRVDFNWMALGFSNNFFGTTLANTNATYDMGDSAADVAGNLPTPGFNPIGGDGTVDAADIDYVAANFGDWLDLNQAVFMDLSCDMNGDLMVDEADVDFVIVDVLESVRGDFDLDGTKEDEVSTSDEDRQTIFANLGGSGYANGDFDLDGDVDQFDRVAFDGSAGLADIAAPFGVLNASDINAFVAGFLAAEGSGDLAMPFGVVNASDINAFVASFLND